MRIVITGAGGFLGNYIARSLKNKNHEVVNFSRHQHASLEKAGISSINGDVKDATSVMAALQGADALIHAAAKVGMAGSWSEFYETNVIGTRNLIEAAKKTSLRYMVYTSSPSVVFGRADIMGADESLNYPKEHLCYYARSKAMAEKAVLAANGDQLKTVALRPHLILGPNDPNLLPRLVSKAKAGRLRRVGEGKNLVDIIHVQNAADAHVLALERMIAGCDVGGKAFFLGQERPVQLWPFINQLLATQNVAPVSKSISASLAYTLGHLLEITWRTMRISSEPPMTRFVAKQLSCSHYFDHTRAWQELGWKPRIDIEQLLLELTGPVEETRDSLSKQTQ